MSPKSPSFDLAYQHWSSTLDTIIQLCSGLVSQVFSSVSQSSFVIMQAIEMVSSLGWHCF